MHHNCQSCGEITMDLLANRKHLNEILGTFCILEADVFSCVKVKGIEFFV